MAYATLAQADGEQYSWTAFQPEAYAKFLQRHRHMSLIYVTWWDYTQWCGKFSSLSSCPTLSFTRHRQQHHVSYPPPKEVQYPLSSLEHLPTGVVKPHSSSHLARHRSRAEQALHHSPGIAQTARQLLGATIVLNEAELEGVEFALFINVGDSSHQGTQDDLGVVLEEVDLEPKRSKSKGMLATMGFPIWPILDSTEQMLPVLKNKPAAFHCWDAALLHSWFWTKSWGKADESSLHLPWGPYWHRPVQHKSLIETKWMPYCKLMYCRGNQIFHGNITVCAACLEGQACLEEVVIHVVAKVLKQCDFLRQWFGECLQCVQVLCAVTFNVLHIPGKPFVRMSCQTSKKHLVCMI